MISPFGRDAKIVHQNVWNPAGRTIRDLLHDTSARAFAYIDCRVGAFGHRSIGKLLQLPLEKFCVEGSRLLRIRAVQFTWTKGFAIFVLLIGLPRRS